jgi:hypothetical protein
MIAEFTSQAVKLDVYKNSSTTVCRCSVRKFFCVRIDTAGVSATYYDR